MTHIRLVISPESTLVNLRRHCRMCFCSLPPCLPCSPSVHADAKMVYCAVINCRSRSARRDGPATSGARFFRIPSIITGQDKTTYERTVLRRQEWLRRIRRNDLGERAAEQRICGRHFVSGKPSYLHCVDDQDWAPSQNLGYPNTYGRSDRIARHQRAMQRAKARGDRQRELLQRQEVPGVVEGVTPAVIHIVPELSSMLQQPPSPPQAQDIVVKSEPGSSVDINHTSEEQKASEQALCTISLNAKPHDVCCQTELDMRLLRAFEADHAALQEEVRRLREKVPAATDSEGAFNKSDECVSSSTGLPTFSVLSALFSLASPLVRHTANSSLSLFQEMLLFFRKLRFNSPLQELARRYGVSQATASRVFNRWLDVFFVVAGDLVRWPDAWSLRQTVPTAFRDCFGTRVPVILDCFEIVLNSPSCQIARVSTLSPRTKRNAAKYLVGIVPQGVVTFVSKGYGGGVSNEALMEHCGILDRLEPGDLVLVDGGFMATRGVGLRCAELVVNEGGKQLSCRDVENTEEFSDVCAHVEKLIGSVRDKYSILASQIPIEFVTTSENATVTTLDKLVVVCCAFCNLCPSIMPFEQYIL